MHERDIQHFAEAAANAASSAALVLAEIQKNDRIAALAARAAAAKAAAFAQEAEKYLAYTRKLSRSNMDAYAVRFAEEAADKAREYAQIAAEKAKWRTAPRMNPSHPEDFEAQVDAIEDAWEVGDFDELVALGALDPQLADELL